MATIAVLGTLDTKGHEHAYVAERIREHGHRTLLFIAGTGGPPQIVECLPVARFACVWFGRLLIRELPATNRNCAGLLVAQS